MDTTTKAPVGPQHALMSEVAAEATRLGISLKDVAERIGMSTFQISRRKLGKAPLTYHEALAMADAVGVSLDVLVQRAHSRG